jgi:hypothetical protein
MENKGRLGSNFPANFMPFFFETKGGAKDLPHMIN